MGFSFAIWSPVPADPGGELVGSGLVWGQVGDRVDGLGVPLARASGVDRAGAAGDLDGLEVAAVVGCGGSANS